MAKHFRSALVTGASSGIGADIARVLAERGCDLVLVARRTDRLEALRQELTAVDVEVVAADLGTDEGMAVVERRLAERPVELLVNNAGVSTTGPFHTSDLAAEDNELRVDVLAPLRLTRVAVGSMVASGHGGILNVSSIAGEQPLRNLATYSASKAFLTRFSESIAGELRGTGVHVTVLKPGYVATEMNPDAPSPDSFAGRFWLRSPDVARAAVDAVERGRPTCVPGLQWRVASEAIQALPHQLVRALTTRVDTG